NLKTSTCLYLTLLIFLSVTAFSQTTNNQKFLQDAATMSMDQVALGNLGQKRLKDPELKKYALTVLNDHMVASAQLKALAKKKKIKLPDPMGVPINSMQTRPDSSASETITNVTDSLNQSFDAEYIDMMVNDNKKAIALFEEGVSSSDKDIKTYALKYIKIYKKHLDGIASVQKKQPTKH
ncbi:MAG: DUF4142 domain-containing protein, partial [Pedobacter sp.]